MLTPRIKRPSFEAESFDMTPIIDVVFLLIIFFMLVCQFIAAEQFQVAVPDQIQSAQGGAATAAEPLTITVMAGPAGQAVYAVGSEKLGAVEGRDLARLIQSEIDRFLAANGSSVGMAHPTKGDSGKTVRLRCDKSVTFGQVKYILSGISKSDAALLDWAVMRE